MDCRGAFMADRISHEELNNCTFDELKAVAQERGVLNIAESSIERLKKPQVYKKTDGTVLSFEEHWSTNQFRFSEENIKKVNLLYNTKCRELVLNHICSEYGNTLADELKVRHTLTKAENNARRRMEYPEKKAKLQKQNRESKKRSRHKQYRVTVQDVPFADSTGSSDPVETDPTATVETSSVDSSSVHVPFPPSPSSLEVLHSGATNRTVDDAFPDVNSILAREPPTQAASSDGYTFSSSLRRRRERRSRSANPEDHEIYPITNDESRVESRSEELDSDVSDDGTYSDEYGDLDDDYDDYIPEELESNCSGHIYDRFGVIRPHEPKFCSSGEIAKGLETAPSPIVYKNLDEVLERLDRGPEIHAVDGDCLRRRYLERRKEEVKNANVVSEIIHLPLGDDFDSWDTPEKLRNNISEMMKSGSLLKWYRFHFRHFWASKDDSNWITVRFECGNSRRFTAADGVSDNRACLAMTSLECDGELYVRVYLKDKLLAFRHNHRHHHADATEPEVPQEIARAVAQTIQIWLSDSGFLQLPRANIITRLEESYPGLPAGYLENQYEKHLTQKYCSSTSDWLSTKAFYEGFPSIYATFVVYQGTKMGLVVILKEILKLLQGRFDSIAVDSTYGMSQHRCEFFEALATIDRIGFLTGFMFIKDVASIEFEVGRVIKKDEINKKMPIPQCQIACEVDAVSRAQYPNTPPTALLSSFFMLLKGTDRKLYARTGKNGICRQDPFPVDGKTDPSVLNMASEIPDGHELACKKYTGLDVRLITCDKDRGEVAAAGFVYPDADIALCLWHALQSLSRAVPVMKVKRYKLTNFFKTTKFPPFFEQVCPSLFAKPHIPSQCPNNEPTNVLNAKYRCIRCFPDVYETWDEPLLTDKPSQDGGDGANNENRPKLQKLLNMFRMHQRAISSVPQWFPFLNYFGPKLLKSPTKSELHQFVLCEMLEFCLSKGLLFVFRYLWTNWYNDEWIRKWTQMHRTTYNLLTTNMICEAFHSLLKRIIGNRRCSIRLDRLAHGIHTAVYPRHMRRLIDILAVSNRTLDCSTFCKMHKISWIDSRWLHLREMMNHEDNSEIELTPKSMLEDYQIFGTDPINFVCGCWSYKIKNLHMCTHIFRCIDRETYADDRKPFIKYELRSSGTPPFYAAPADLSVQELDNINVWPCLKWRHEYLEFLQSFVKPTLIDEPMDFFLPEGTATEDTIETHQVSTSMGLDPVSQGSSLILDIDRDESHYPEEIEFLFNCMETIKRLPFASINGNIRKDLENLSSHFHQYTVAALSVEIEKKSPNRLSTVKDRRHTRPYKAAVLKLPQEVRDNVIQRAISSGVVSDSLVAEYNRLHGVNQT